MTPHVFSHAQPVHLRPLQRLKIERKLALTIRDAAAYSNVGINKMDELLRQRSCPLVLFVGTKKLVNRKEFEAFISDACAI